MSDFGKFPGGVLAEEYRRARERMQEIASELDGDEAGYLVAKVAEIKRRR